MLLISSPFWTIAVNEQNQPDVQTASWLYGVTGYPCFVPAEMYQKEGIMKNIVFCLSLIFLLSYDAGNVWAGENEPTGLAYVLQPEQLAENRSAVVQKLANCDRDWIILDVSYAGDEQSRWSRAELQTIRGGRESRKVIAYLSIGEAEDYRSYWKPGWKQNPPEFLLKENPDWPGNHAVKFWMEQWQRIILNEVDKISSQGFDGLYLDKVDIFEDFEFDPQKRDWIDNRFNPATKHSYRKDMISLVQAIARAVRRENRSALIIPQNGSPLLEDRSYRQTIDAIGVEDLFTNGEQRQNQKETRYRISFLEMLKKQGKPILCIEYPESATLKNHVIKKATQLGYRFLITDRELNVLGESR